MRQARPPLLVLCAARVAVLAALHSGIWAITGQESFAGPGEAAKPPVPLQAAQQERYRNIDLFTKVISIIEANYVDEVKHKDLIYGAIKGMLETLDPHSNFLPPEIFKEMKIDTSGKFGGLGIEIGMKDGVLTIIAPIEDTPAWHAGLKPGDRILRIANESTKGLTLVEAVSKMRGKKGTPVLLQIYRDGWEKFRDVSLTRDTIMIKSVKTDELESGYGYLKLTTFNENSSTDVKRAIEKFEGKGKKLRGLVFDLRTNPGGLLDQAVEVSSLFVEDKRVVVSTIGRNKDQREVKHTHHPESRRDFPMAVLVNSSTASAAEIVAGALQDHRRGIVMGQPTFGKGSVQQVVELGDETGLKLTIARYYTPSGRSIQEKGVAPDIYLDDFDPKLLAEAKRRPEGFRERDLKGHMTGDEDQPPAAGAERPGDAGTPGSKDEKGKEYKLEDFDLKPRGGGESKKKEGKGKGEEEELAPVRVNPKDDYQVREALNYLKSFDLFKKIATVEDRK